MKFNHKENGYVGNSKRIVDVYTKYSIWRKINIHHNNGILGKEKVILN